MSSLERFHTKYDEVGECWEWNGGLSNHNVPIFCYEKKRRTARRFILEHKGLDLTGKFVRYKCNNYLCVNPDHLRVLSKKEYMASMVKDSKKSPLRSQKIAKTKQERYGKITMEQANEIRMIDGTCRVIAAQYGISASLVTKIRRNEAWAGTNIFTGLMR